jgi:hypothetical protein
MPTAFIPSYAIIGTGTINTSGNQISPINLSYRSIHGQSVYTAAELNAAGIFGPISIIQMGFNISTAPDQALPNFVVRMKHTTDSDVANWQSSTGMVTVYTNASYMPVAGGYQMLTLSTPFNWNGTDNLVIDTAFNLVAAFSHTGTLQYTSMSNGYRATLSDAADQTGIFTGGTLYSRRPNVRLTFLPISSIDSPVVTIETVTGGVRLNWTAITGATRYLVYASENPATGYVQIAQVTGTQYDDTLALQHRYYYVTAATGAPARVSKRQ